MAELRIPMTDDRDGRIVLIVRENLVLRVEVAETFKEAGFKVFQVETADEAILVLRREPMIPVVFTEIHLPGTMDGLTFAHYVRLRWPPTILLVASARIPQAILPSKARFVQKPYLAGGLAKVVDKVVSQMARSTA
jgi:DNA-binding NtrC family response regulator